MDKLDISSLRKYRIKLDEISTKEFLNNTGNGISLFDLIGTFVIAYILEDYITSFLKIKKDTYYLSLIPLGIIIHYFTNQNTFLNTQLTNNTFNIYKIIIFVTLYLLYKSIST